MKVDVAIIGGGPAGITAGVILKKKGYSCVIVDKAAFPREKLCGGVLTLKALNKIKALYHDSIFKDLKINEINTLEIYDDTKQVDQYQLKNSFSVIERKEMDQELMNYFKQIGGVLRERQSKYVIDYEHNTIMLENGDKIHYKVLMGTDGINSSVRKYVEHKELPLIFCFEQFVPINRLHPEDKISIHFGVALGGYAWKIPSYQNLGIGLGELKIRNSKKTYDKFLKYCSRFEGRGASRVKGAAVSCGIYVKKPMKNNVLLAGDAARLVDAITGEGIYFAVYSAEIAAFTIDRYFKKKAPLANYNHSIKRIHKIMNEQNIYNKLLFCPFLQKLILAYVKANHGFAQLIFDEVISAYGYSYTKAIAKWQMILICKLCDKK